MKKNPIENLKPKDLVKCIRGHNDERILEQGKIYEIAVVVKKGLDYAGYPTAGFILSHTPLLRHDIQLTRACPFPYIWDFNRFEIYDRFEIIDNKYIIPFH